MPVSCRWPAFRIHDFLEYNFSRAQAEANRELRANAGRLGGLRSGEVRRGRRVAPPELSLRTGQADANRDRSSDRPEPKTPIKLGNDKHKGNDRQVPTPEPEPEPEPDARSLKKRGARTDDGQRRVDIDALRERQGFVSELQARVLDEICRRHDVTGPNWAAQVIHATPSGGDALGAVMAADQAWQSERRSLASQQERAWDADKALERVAAAAAFEGQRRPNGTGGHA